MNDQLGTVGDRENASTQAEPKTLVFQRPDSSFLGVAGLILLGFLFAGFAAIGFYVALLGRVGQFALQSMTTFPLLMAFAIWGHAWSIRRRPAKVAVTADRLIVEFPNGRQQFFPWKEIGLATEETAVIGLSKVLQIFDTKGKTLLKIGEGIPGFPQMCKAIQSRIAERGAGVESDLKLGKAKRSAVVLAVCGVIAMSFAVLGWTMSREKAREEQLLRDHAIEGEAKILRRFLAPNGITCRLEYEVTTSEGKTGMRNAELERGYWAQLEGATSVGVRFVPEEPQFSRVLQGEVENDDVTETPTAGYLMAGGAGLFGLVLFSIAGFAWYGWDISDDSGKTRITRYGKPVF